MRYLISNWKGFEIDSSEFWVSITSSDVPRLIKAFLESPFIEGSGLGTKWSGKGYVPTFLKAISLAKRENKELLESIKIKEKSLLELADEYEMSEEVDLIELAIAIKFLVEEFPHLIYEFNSSTLTFYRKTVNEDVAKRYTFSIAGAPVQYETVWYEEDEWSSVLSSISKKAPFDCNTWL